MVQLTIIDTKTRETIDIADLTATGRQQMAFEATQLLEQLEEAENEDSE